MCLGACAALLGQNHDARALRARYPATARGVSHEGLLEIARTMGLMTRTVRIERGQLATLPTPLILEYGSAGRYIVLQRMTRAGRARIFDPASGWSTTSRKELEERCRGIGIEVLSAAPISSRPARPRLSVFDVFRWSPGVPTALAQTLLATVLLQIYVVTAPLYMRIVVDDVLVNADRDLLISAALGFGLFTLFNAGCTILRGVASQRLNYLMSWDMSRRVFHHLLQLPLEWFQTRRLPDVLSRLQGVEQVRTAMASGMTSVLDGVTAALTLTMLLLVAPKLAALALGGLGLYVVTRLIAIPLNLRLANRNVLTSVAENGAKLETVRAIQTVKALAAEPARESEWASRFADSIRTSQDIALLGVGFSTIQNLFTALIGVAVIYVGARDVLSGEMTLGLLTAAIAYQTQFSQKANGLFEQIVSWRMLDVQLERLADIVLEPVEPGSEDRVVKLGGLRGALSMQQVSYRYGPDEPNVLDSFSMEVDAGEHVAIVGPSGVGKSTLLKVLTGLYRPSEGLVKLDGRPLAAWGPTTVRHAMGIVMQGDHLLYGSIADNISFFAERPDLDLVWRSLALAGLDDDVKMMPLGLNTQVGDLGDALSGGQKQRILIARALYRQPRILILDEATSHLDVARERTIAETLRHLSITRIVVAHRPETIAAADRVIRLAPPGAALQA